MSKKDRRHTLNPFRRERIGQFVRWLVMPTKTPSHKDAGNVPSRLTKGPCKRPTFQFLTPFSTSIIFFNTNKICIIAIVKRIKSILTGDISRA